MSTTYLHTALDYYFARNQLIDIEIGRALGHSLPRCLDLLERTHSTRGELLEAGLALLAAMVEMGYWAGEGGAVRGGFRARRGVCRRVADSEGLRIVVLALGWYLDRLAEAGHKAGIDDQMVIKTLMNVIYCILFECVEQALRCQDRDLQMQQIKASLEQLELDSLLIRMVTLTLEVHYLPIKKLVILYMRVLLVLFYSPGQAGQLYLDSQMMVLCHNNRLPENFLKDYSEKNKPELIRNSSKNNPVQSFYVQCASMKAKNNVGDCPLAQSIVVGLLRSLLTICNSQSHKKFQRCPAKGSGADSYRQWQISYQFISSLEPENKYRKLLSGKTVQMLEQYLQFNESVESQPEKANLGLYSSPHYEFYRHKIYTTAAISTFFSFLLVSFSKNVKIQSTYFYQLISDANGILVFLKFLTDKFQSLSPPSESVEANTPVEPCNEESMTLGFKNEVMLTVHSVLLVLFGACNNYAEKTRSYLFEYNSYLIIKKIPHIFMHSHKDDEQLPSQQQIQAQFDSKLPQKSPSATQWQPKIQQLTELCYSLLKIQIPFFSKKMKQNANNMKMIVDIYCQMPGKHPEPTPRTQLEKLMLKNNIRKNVAEKYILSVEELKGVHNQYNNMYYWSNEQAKIEEANEKSAQKKEQPFSVSREAMEQWLENNLWKFYD